MQNSQALKAELHKKLDHLEKNLISCMELAPQIMVKLLSFLTPHKLCSSCRVVLSIMKNSKALIMNLALNSSRDCDAILTSRCISWLSIKVISEFPKEDGTTTGTSARPGTSRS